MKITANEHPYRVTAVEGSKILANQHPILVEIEGGVVTPEEFEELEKKVDALSTDLTYKGSVEDYAHLPSDAETGDVYTTEDTGVLYVWDGTEWVALNETVSTGGRVLTTDDYNYHSTGDVDDGIALWLLPAGTYLVEDPTALKVYISRTKVSNGGSGQANSNSYQVLKARNSAWTYIILQDANTDSVYLQKDYYSNGTDYGWVALGQDVSFYITGGSGAPTTSTQAKQVGAIYEDTSTGDIYHCVAISGNTYTWEKVGGSDNFRVLTTADYDYPTNNPNGVALWKLPNGVYVKENKDVKVYNNNATSGVTTATRMNTLMEGAQVIIIADDRYTQGYVHIRTFGDDGTYDYTIGAGSASTYSKVGSTTGTLANVENDGKAITGRELGQVILSGAGAPTTSTRASTGCLYEDTTNGKLYICTNVSGSTYTWEEVGGINSISMADWNALFGQTIENVNGVGL